MNIPIWNGSSSFSPGLTPFGFYDTDPDFVADADKFAKFAAHRMGYPIVDIELQDINFYTAFEEAITTYGNEVYAFQIQDNMLSFQGAPNNIGPLNNQLIQPNLANDIRLADQYGVEAGVGGNVTWYSASIDLVENVQSYDLNAWASSSLNISGSNLEIKMVYYQSPPALTRYFDPYTGIGTGAVSGIDGFGGGTTPYTNMLMMPINYDIQRLQMVEFNDQIRRSQYTFELVNNHLRIFPIPTKGDTKLWIKYIIKSDRNNPIAPNSNNNLITNPSNVPFTNPVYSQINSIGRSWIFEYGLATAKEILGYVRGKYSQIPIPGSELTLNQSDLIAAATSEKTSLIERLRAHFADTSRNKQMENKSNEVDFHNKTLAGVPLTIYIG